MAETVEFDPGIGELVGNFNEFINNVYSKLMSLHSINQKKTAFRLHFNKIENNIKNNIAFYLGCLLWAYYIKNSNTDNPKDITGNIFLYLTEEQKEQFDYKITINFLKNYLEVFTRDTSYFMGKKYIIPTKWNNILSLYSEFLDLNQGFVNTKTTADIKLPDKLENAVLSIDINKLIKEAIEEKNLEKILQIENLEL